MHGPPCPGLNPGSFVWITPDSTPYYGKSQTIKADASHTGEWRLLILTPKGCYEEHRFNITVGSCCISNPNFTTIGGSCNPISFKNLSTGITNHVSTIWNFGDGTISNELNPTHSYNVSTPTPFNVCLTMLFEDGQGESCCEQVCQVVQVCPSDCEAHAVFDYTHTGSPNVILFSGLSTGNGTICKYEWNFGDGVIHTIKGPGPWNVWHSFIGPGPWWVCLTVTNCTTNAAGQAIECTDTKCMWVYPPMFKDDGQAKASDEQPGLTVVAAQNTQLGDSKGFSVYPNPSNGSFSVSLDKRSGPYQVVVRDAQAREVYRKEHLFGNDAVKITLSDAAVGVYSVEIGNDTEKLIRQVTITK
jgi:PKD repeat protein